MAHRISVFYRRVLFVLCLLLVLGSIGVGTALGQQRIVLGNVDSNNVNDPISFNGDKAPPASTKRLKIASFYMKDGTLVTGKVVNEDSSKITVAAISGSQIVVSTYGVRDIDMKTRSFRSMLPVDYYLEVGDYFYSKTGDFVDDTDDFIQAIAFFEKAKRALVVDNTDDPERVQQIQTKIDTVQLDRQVWIRETKNRAELKRQEFEANFDTQLDALDMKIEANIQSMQALQVTLTQLEDSVSDLDKEVAWNIGRLVEEAQATQDDIAYLRERQYSPSIINPAGAAGVYYYPPQNYPSIGTQPYIRYQQRSTTNTPSGN